MIDTSINPFRFGDYVSGEAFTDRDRECRELVADARNGQNVVLFAPRRFGKSSLMLKVAEQLRAEGVLVASVDVMRAPNKPKLAALLARTIHDDLASPLYKAGERLRFLKGLRIQPTVTIDPDDGALGFSFAATPAASDIDDTLERLFEVPARIAADRGKRVVIIFDEFQDIVDIDPRLPALMRSVFQAQSDVAHFYLGSRRHMMERIFNDVNEPFWKSAKPMELGPIPEAEFRAFIEARFVSTNRRIEPVVIDMVLNVTRCHPNATQLLAYFLWQEVLPDETASTEQFVSAMSAVLRAQHGHFERVWESAAVGQRLVLAALAREAGRPLASDYRLRHGLGTSSSVQAAVGVLVRDELVERLPDGTHRLAEPFLDEWILTRAT